MINNYKVSIFSSQFEAEAHIGLVTATTFSFCYILCSCQAIGSGWYNEVTCIITSIWSGQPVRAWSPSGAPRVSQSWYGSKIFIFCYSNFSYIMLSAVLFQLIFQVVNQSSNLPWLQVEYFSRFTLLGTPLK